MTERNANARKKRNLSAQKDKLFEKLESRKLSSVVCHYDGDADVAAQARKPVTIDSDKFTTEGCRWSRVTKIDLNFNREFCAMAMYVNGADSNKKITSADVVEKAADVTKTVANAGMGLASWGWNNLSSWWYGDSGTDDQNDASEEEEKSEKKHSSSQRLDGKAEDSELEQEMWIVFGPGDLGVTDMTTKDYGATVRTTVFKYKEKAVKRNGVKSEWSMSEMASTIPSPDSDEVDF